MEHNTGHRESTSFRILIGEWIVKCRIGSKEEKHLEVIVETHAVDFLEVRNLNANINSQSHDVNCCYFQHDGSKGVVSRSKNRLHAFMCLSFPLTDMSN